MATILQLSRDLDQPPRPSPVAGVRLRHFEHPRDVERWLELRRRAFADEPFGAGTWTPADFQREFLDQSWWQPQRMWFAEAATDNRPTDAPIGAITLAVRDADADRPPAVHWMMVLPQWRGRGVGRLLLQTVEAQAWDLGHRRLRLETHTQWSAAVALYQKCGYRSAT